MVEGTGPPERWRGENRHHYALVVSMPDEVLEAIRRSGHLCLDVSHPGWDNARGYLFDEENGTLYFPVAKKYLPADPSSYRVLTWGQPKVLVTGELQPAISDEDMTTQL